MGSKRVFAVALVVLGLTVAACGAKDSGGVRPGSIDGSGDLSLVLAAAQVTTQAGSSKISVDATMSGGAQQFTMTGAGAYDYARHVGTMTLSLQGEEVPQELSGYEIRFIKQTIYMKFPAAFARIVPGLKTWVRMDPKDFASQQSGGFPGLGSLTNQDPTATLAFIQGAEDVKSVGLERVRDAQTTHFTLTVDLKKAAQALPEVARAGVGDLVSKAGLVKLPMDLWIDDQGRVRRTTITMDLSKVAAGATPASALGLMELTTELFDFGIDVAVTAPAAGDVSEFSEVSKLSGG